MLSFVTGGSINVQNMLIAAVIIIFTAAAIFIFFKFRGRKETPGQSILRYHGVLDFRYDSAIGLLPDPTITRDNHHDSALNGHALFPAMLAAIYGKEPSITFDGYTHRAGEIDEQFAATACGANRADVRVYVLLDQLAESES